MLEDLEEFLDEDPGELVPAELGTTLVDSQTMTKREMNRSILRVYNKLGGDAWLLVQAQLYPKEFMSMLKPLIEKDEDNSITAISITVDGESVRVEGRSHKELGVLSASRH